MKPLRHALALLPLVLLLASTSRAQSFDVFLDGPSESPANASPGTGFGTVVFDSIAHTMTINLSFTGLLGTTSAAHIHAATTTPFAGTAVVATQTPSFVGFPLGVTSGAFSNSFDMTLASSFRAGFITANGGTPATAEAALIAAANTGRAYFNIHTTTFGGGEIRGFLVHSAAPEPATAALALLGLGVLAYRRKRA
jgi:hypothetical protein